MYIINIKSIIIIYQLFNSLVRKGGFICRRKQNNNSDYGVIAVTVSPFLSFPWAFHFWCLRCFIWGIFNDQSNDRDTWLTILCLVNKHRPFFFFFFCLLFTLNRKKWFETIHWMWQPLETVCLFVSYQTSTSNREKSAESSIQ